MPETAYSSDLSPAVSNDAELARRVLAGDATAFEAIMRQHNRMLFRAARAILRSDADAEDALQAAYLLAFRAMAKFRGESRLSTWLARIVINESIARQRRYATDARIIPIDTVVDADGYLPLAVGREPEHNAPEQSAMRSETRALIERKIDVLPDQFRVVFMLRAVEELSVEETANSLGIPEATVRTRFFRARSLLRESLARDVDVAMQSAFAFDGARCDRIVEKVLASLQVSDLCAIDPIAPDPMARDRIEPPDG